MTFFGSVTTGTTRCGSALYCCKLDDLRIDHHEAKLVRRKLVEQRGDDGVDANGFARAGAAGDEHVRHLREVRDDRMAVNILAQRERDARLGVLPFVRFEQVAHDDLGLDRGSALRCRPRIFPGTGARMWMRSALSAAAMLFESAEIFSSFTPGAGCNS